MFNTMFANDVRQTLDHFRRSVDQMFENFYGYPAQTTTGAATGERNWTFSPVLESGWSDQYLTMRAVLPSVAEKNVHVSVQNNQLIIEGERIMPPGLDKSAFTQLAYGKFYAAVTLPSGLDLEHVDCRLHDGVLDLRIPISEASKPKRIEIKPGTTEAKTITA